MAALGTCVYTYGQVTKPLDDTWTFDGERWNQVDAGPGPGRGQMAWDIAGQQLIFFGYGPLQTWAFQSRKWVMLHPRHTPPVAGYWMASTSDGIFLVGGRFNGYESSATGTWLWRNGDWTDLGADFPGHDSGPLAYNSKSNRLVMSGHDLKEWSGNVWSSLGTGSDSTTIAYDPGRDLFLSLGCPYVGSQSNCGTWSWSQGSTAPTRIGDLPYGVGAAFGTLIYFSPLNEILLVANSWDDDKMAVYEESAQSKWQIRKVTGAPASRKYASVGVDPTSGVIVMYGGCGRWSSCSGPSL